MRSTLRTAAGPAAGLRIRLVAIVRDGKEVLVRRDHDAAPWRLPATPWVPGANPVEVLRDLLACDAGVMVSPTLHASVRLSSSAGLLVFTATPLGAELLGTARTYRWLNAGRIRAVMPPVDQHLVNLTSIRARPRVSRARCPSGEERHLSAVPNDRGPRPTAGAGPNAGRKPMTDDGQPGALSWATG